MEFGQGKGIEDVVFLEPTFACDGDAEEEILEALGGVGIGVEGCKDAFGLSEWPPSPIEVEPARVAVEFDDGAGIGGGVEDGRDVDGVGVAFEEEAAGGVSEHGDQRM